MNLAPILDPAARKKGPKPAAVNLQKVFLIGTAAWVVAFIVISVLLFVFHLRVVTLPFLTCILGVCLGIALLIWEKWYRPEYTKLAEGDDD